MTQYDRSILLGILEFNISLPWISMIEVFYLTCPDCMIEVYYLTYPDYDRSILLDLPWLYDRSILLDLPWLSMIVVFYLTYADSVW
jgi:hypothetical protein